jgi:cytochrome P450
MSETIERVPIKTRRPESCKDVPAHVPLELVHELDYLDTNSRVDPFSTTENIYEELPPVFYNPSVNPIMYRGVWVVTRYEDIREVYQNDRLYSTEGAAGFQKLMGETFRMIPLAVDPPEHAKYRMLLNPWFSPKAITAMEPGIRSVINELIDSFIDKGECDIAYDFGRIYPVKVFLDLMGFPFEKFEDFLQWGYAILHANGNAERMTFGVKSALAFLREFIEQVRKTPNDKLGSAIVHGMIDGKPIAEDDIIGAMFFLWVGGLDTVAATTAHMFRRLALQPELQAHLRAHPELASEAVEEFLRMQPLVNSPRLVKEDHEIRGIKIRKGEHVLAYNAAGNFDPAEFENPREFRVDRISNRHFTLAGGSHRCLGSHLARRELRIALTEFLRRVPPFHLKEGASMDVSPGLIAAPRLPIVWTPPKA